MNILFVDDEQQVIQYMKLLVSWKEHGYTFYSASNGKEACQMLEKQSIDIMCLDLTMPLMDGFEVLDWMKEKNVQNVEVIIMSCHDEFEIVKRAMKYNCHDFILKNTITAQNIIQVLNQVKLLKEDKLKKKSVYLEMAYKAEENEKNNKNLELGRWLCKLSDILENPFNSTTLDHYACLSVTIYDYKKIIHRYSNSDINQFHKVFESMIRDTFSECDNRILQLEYGKYVVLLHVLNTAKTTTYSLYKESVQSLKENFERLMNIQCSIVSTHLFDNFFEFPTLYHSLQAIEELQFFDYELRIFYSDDYHEDLRKKQILLRQLIRDLFAKLTDQQHNYFDLILDQFAEDCLTYHTLITIQDFISAIRNAFFLYTERTNMDIPQFPIKEYESFDDLKKEVNEYMKPFKINEEKNLNYAVSKTIMFIKNHYSEDLHLQMIADHLEMTPTYLSRIFSAEMGISLTQFITQYRIDIAKKLIQDTTMKFYEIGEQVGFKSSIMFSTTFKKVANMTPGQYRDQIYQITHE